jgi:MbtH protein
MTNPFEDGGDTRQTCLDYVEENWTDMRPKSLAEVMGSAARD